MRAIIAERLPKLFVIFKLDSISCLIEIHVDSLHNLLRIGCHLPVSCAARYFLVKTAAYNYWMFLHPIIGCTYKYRITSNSSTLAYTGVMGTYTLYKIDLALQDIKSNWIPCWAEFGNKQYQPQSKDRRTASLSITP